MSQEVVDRVTHLLHQFDARVQAAPADSWSNQSPCSEWKARDVVVHVGNNLRRLTAGMSGAAPSEIGSDEEIGAAWNSSLHDFLTGLGTADLSVEIPGPMGPMAMEHMIGRFVCNDILVHTWDLARSVGGDEQLDAAAVAGAYEGLKPMDAMIRRPGIFADRIDRQDVDLQTEFLAFLGRTV
jgi:uncharacterized protein (TIGR03086 family)